MRVYLRGKVYWFELVFNGARIQHSTKVRNARIAGQIASAFHTALVKGEVGIVERRPVPTFDVAMKSFLAWSAIEHAQTPGTRARYADSSGALLRCFKKTPLDRISAEDVENFKIARAGEKGKQTKRRLAPATVNRELACLRIVFNHAIKGNPDLRNPVSAVSFLDEDNLQDRILTFAEQRAYLAHADPVLLDVAELILEHGCRPGEVFELEAGAVHLDKDHFRIVRGKTKAAKRRIELTPKSREILARRIETAAAGLLFFKERSKAQVEAGVAPEPLESLQSQHRKALKDSKVLPFRLYDLRHTWATRAAEVTDLVTLAAMLGHSRIQMVLRYAHPTQDHQTNATSKISAHKLDMENREKARIAADEARREARTLKIVPKTA